MSGDGRRKATLEDVKLGGSRSVRQFPSSSAGKAQAKTWRANTIVNNEPKNTSIFLYIGKSCICYCLTRNMSVGGAEAMSAANYKLLKEAFVTGHHGGSVWEITQVTLVAPVCPA